MYVLPQVLQVKFKIKYKHYLMISVFKLTSKFYVTLFVCKYYDVMVVNVMVVGFKSINRFPG